MSQPLSFLFRRPTTHKTCPACATALPATLQFCTHCGAPVAGVTQVQISNREDLTQFQIPDYLLRDSSRSHRFDYEPAGTGLVWLGLALITIPAATANISPISIGAWIIGVGSVLAGVARARIDSSAMLRAGAATSAAALLAMAVIGNEVLHPNIRGDNEVRPMIVATEVAVEETASQETVSGPPASAFAGRVPMYRGGSGHTGEHPGPGISGNPYRAWRYETGGTLKSTPAIANGSAYFGTQDGYLIALDLLTGLPRWRYDLQGYPVSSAPAVVDRTVYVSSGYAVFAIDEQGNDERWRFDMSYAGESSPVVKDGVVYVASKEHLVYALDASTGEVIWKYRTDGLIFGSPSLTDELVIIGGDDGDIFGIDRKTGISRWKYQAPSGVFSTIAIASDKAIITLRQKSVLALDVRTGKPVWEFPVGGDASPATSGADVYVGGDDGAIYAIDADTGGPAAWVFPTGNGATLSPVIVGDTIYVAAGPSLFSLDRQTGAENWHYPIGDWATTEPVVVDGVVYIGAEDGNLYAITGDGRTGTPTSAEA